MTKFQAINDNVIVKVETQKVTEAGLIKPFSAVNKKEGYVKGLVVSVGQDCKFVKPGDTVAFLNGDIILEQIENDVVNTDISLLREYMIAAIIK